MSPLHELTQLCVCFCELVVIDRQISTLRLSLEYVGGLCCFMHVLRAQTLEVAPSAGVCKHISFSYWVDTVQYLTICLQMLPAVNGEHVVCEYDGCSCCRYLDYFTSHTLFTQLHVPETSKSDVPFLLTFLSLKHKSRAATNNLFSLSINLLIIFLTD